ncbi:MAG: ion transporter, partial [Actinomycetota bacterium]
MTESVLDSQPRARALERYRHLSEGPLLVLALLMIPLLLVPLVFALPSSVEEVFVATDYLIWALFAVDYIVRLYLAPRRWGFVRNNVPDLFIVAIPFLRPLRILRSARALRLLRLARLGAFAHQGLRELRKV